MTQTFSGLAAIIFFATIAATFAASYLGRRHSARAATGALADQKLSKWLVGLSAGATANSGFVVTGAVGLGYAFGAQWLLLPIAWLLGDILFWTIFPQRINRIGRETAAVTITDIIADGLTPSAVRITKQLVALIALACLGGYVAAQWLAGEKFLNGAFGFSGTASLLSFAGLIILYTAIGGFRGSVYADSLQAIIRLIGTTIAILALAVVANQQGDGFWMRLSAAGDDFLNLMPAGLGAAALFILGFAAAALGFGLGQPQMVTRYMAGSSPSETRAAWWIYIGFVQFTWITMTVFGIVLRGIVSGLPDPETGFSYFFSNYTGPILTGIIVADIFATIAATSNSLLVAMAQTMKYDLLLYQPEREGPGRLWPMTLGLGALTMIASSMLSDSVVGLVLSSVALMGAGLAPAMIARTLGWRRTSASVIVSILVGIGAAALWKIMGLGAVINEAAPGIAAGLIAGLLITIRLPTTDIRIGGETT